ncbi:hypothetical protein AZI86_14585 [Bdellovibrio bacteriovorus]|uniref:HTH cro/C1-type domain-containing protein n=1 Tax=Bdellovibrio bacteriovorus TaxID=959 RepID=A0A150WKG7_BDEBC|nr:helix-turn-helix transcriptional regulator [Bdellovibrio bacteriovorus]KYG64031.1 hypothetical protein AZI86_14585 [Bdellovibrio bacteriovorus]
MSKKSIARKTSTLHLGPTIARFMARHGIRQVELCEEVGMTPAQMSNFLRGRKDVTSSNLMLILEALGIDITTLIRRQLGETENLHDTVRSQLITLPDCERGTLMMFLQSFQSRFQTDHRRQKRAALDTP